MQSKALIFIALVLVCSVFAEENSQYGVEEMAHHKITGDEPKDTDTIDSYGGGAGVPTGGGASIPTGGGAGGATGGGPGGYSAGFSHGGVYGGGQICKWGCCSESFGYSHTGGGYYGCTCCGTAAEAEAYNDSQAKAESKN